MPDTPDLTGFTLLIVFATACIVPQIRPYDVKKRHAFRWLTVLLAIVIHLVVLIPQLKTYPPTDQYIVYVTETGSKYHAGSCRHLWNSKIPIVFEEAIIEGYRDCANCATPAYHTEEIRITIADLYPSLTTENLGIVITVIVLYFVVFAGIYHLHKLTKKGK